MGEQNPTRDYVVQLLRKIAADVERGDLVLIDHRVRDEVTLKLRLELAAPADAPSPSPSPLPSPPRRDRCPNCGAGQSEISDCGTTPKSDPPTVDLLCVRCQHAWAVPQEG